MYDSEMHHRRLIRLKGYDYSQTGAYFVTMCVKNKENWLGKITDGEEVLSEIGSIAEKCWNEILTHYPCVQLDKYVIMPNHIHGIIKIIDNDFVGAENLQPLHQIQPLPKINQYQKIISKSLGSIIRGFKIGVTKWCNLHKYELFAWQRNYHEHIVRNEKELNRIREYIVNNPLRWQFDRENPECVNVGVGLKPTPTDYNKQWDDFEEAIFGEK